MEPRPGLDAEAAGPDPFRATEARLAWGVGLLCAAQVALWLPSYLTWPYWADHDVFSTAAHAWSVGIAPYRDLRGNNLPGTTYVFYVLGTAFGWGRTWPFYAFDAAILVALGLLLGRWSLARYGSRLAGLVGFATYLGYALDLDYSQAAQRDWQGPFFAVASILLIQAGRGRASLVVAGLSMAAGASIRPQVALFLPGVAVALADRGRSGDRATGGLVGAAVAWAAGMAVGAAILVAPLAATGNLGDLGRMLRLVAPGGHYNVSTWRKFREEILNQVAPFRIWAVPAGVVLLTRRAGAGGRWGPEWAWLATFGAVLAYRPISPQMHAYLYHPITLAWSVLVAALAGLIATARDLSTTGRVLALLLLLGLGAAFKPRFSNPGGSASALGDLRRGAIPTRAPAGYVKNPRVPSSEKYRWADYRKTLEYVASLPPSTRVANALKHVPAINGPTGRLPAFPAESIAWLIMVRKEDERAFADALRSTPDSAVVWAPSERDTPGLLRIPELTATIEELYEPDRAFGVIEVWRRRPGSRGGP